MKRSLVTVVMILFLFIIGWPQYIIPGKGLKVMNGYTYEMVESVLGRPAKIENQDKMTKWVYTSDEGKRILFFENGKVVVNYTRGL